MTDPERDISESAVHAVAEAIWMARRLNEWFPAGFSAHSTEYRAPYYHEARKAIEAYERLRQTSSADDAEDRAS